MRWKDIIEKHKIELYEACFDAKYKALTEHTDYYVMIYNDGTVSVQNVIDVESYDDGSAKLIYEASHIFQINNITTIEELNEVCTEQNDYFTEIINRAIDEC